ncbi:hypothetical protein LINPERPRIM_LOCUS27897 [Linum perenne]
MFHYYHIASVKECNPSSLKLGNIKYDSNSTLKFTQPRSEYIANYSFAFY